MARHRSSWGVDSGDAPSWSRRHFLLAGGTLGLGALLAEGTLLAPRRLTVSRHTLGDGEAGGEQIRFAILADLHLRGIGRLHEELAAAVDAARPDVILFLGDSVDDPDALPILADLLALLPRDTLRFATLGNWEYWGGVDLQALRRVYEAGDTGLLVNEGVPLSPRAALFAVDDAVGGRPDLGHLPSVEERRDTLILSHCPGFRDEVAGAHARRVSAVVSGHTHGGQIALGRWAPVLPPGSGGYVSGWYRGGASPDLFVSRGLGTSVLPVRLGSPPELAILDWMPGP